MKLLSFYNRFAYLGTPFFNGWLNYLLWDTLYGATLILLLTSKDAFVFSDNFRWWEFKVLILIEWGSGEEEYFYWIYC